MKSFDKDHVSLATINKLKTYIEKPEQFKSEEVKKVSSAAAVICTWCGVVSRDIHLCQRSERREVATKRQRSIEATEGLVMKQGRGLKGSTGCSCGRNGEISIITSFNS